jgi:hypothetical protein
MAHNTRCIDASISRHPKAAKCRPYLCFLFSAIENVAPRTVAERLLPDGFLFSLTAGKNDPP